MKRFLFNGYAVWENNIFYFDVNNFLPSKLDIETGKITHVENLKNYNCNGSVSIDRVICHKGIIYALKMSGDQIIIWDIKKSLCKYIPIDYKEKVGENFAYMCCVDDMVYIFPKYKSEILMVDKDGNIEKLLYDKDALGELTCGCVVNKKVYLFPKEGEEYIFFDIEKQTCDLVPLNMKVCKVISCTCNKEAIYILNMERDVYILNLQKKKVEYLDYGCEYVGESKVSKVLFAGNKLLVFPSYAEDIQILDLKTNKMECYLNYPEDFCYSDVAWSKYYGCTEDKKYYYLIRKSNYLLKIDKETAELKWTKLFAPEDADEIKTLTGYGKKEFFEKNITLKSFVNTVFQNVDRSKRERVGTGEEIWDKLR